jgi:hypothetical protein
VKIVFILTYKHHNRHYRPQTLKMVLRTTEEVSCVSRGGREK